MHGQLCFVKGPLGKVSPQNYVPPSRKYLRIFFNITANGVGVVNCERSQGENDTKGKKRSHAAIHPRIRSLWAGNLKLNGIEVQNIIHNDLLPA